MNRSRLIGVVVLVACVAAGVYWYLKTPTQPPADAENTDKFGKEVNIKTLLGTLSFTPKTNDQTEPSDYWLYVDDRIVAAKPNPKTNPEASNPIDILLVPGEYNVEVAVTTPDPENAVRTFPLVFRSQKVTIAAGQVTKLRLDIAAAPYDEPTALSPFVEPSWDWYDGWVRKINNEISDFQKDPTQVAILEVFNALQQSPPVAPSVYINLPAERGGGREFDSRQVRLIVGWLKRNRQETLSPLPASFVDSMPPEMRLKYENEALRTINQYQDYVDQFDAISTKLEAAKK